MTKEQEEGGGAVNVSAFQPGRSGFFCSEKESGLYFITAKDLMITQTS